MSTVLQEPTQELDNTGSDYKKESARFREAWIEGTKQAKIAHEALNRMIVILHEDNPDWSMREIALTIAIDHADLEGFSKTKIYNELSEENRRILQDTGFPKGGKRKNPKKNTEQASTEPPLDNIPTSDQHSPPVQEQSLEPNDPYDTIEEELIALRQLDIMKPDNGESVFHYENIGFDSAKINWDKIRSSGKRIKHFYIELSDVKDLMK